MARSVFRKPSLKRSFKARTTGKYKRAIKKATIPGYGHKGMGALRNPKRSAYNAVYHRTSIDTLKPLKKSNSNTESSNYSTSSPTPHKFKRKKSKWNWILYPIYTIFGICVLGWLFSVVGPWGMCIIAGIAIACLICYFIG